MNLKRWLMAPWVAANRAMRWFMLSFAVLCALLSACVRVFLGGPDAATTAVYPLACAVGLAWLFFLPNMLILIIMAHKLCLPGIRRDVNGSLCLYAVLGTLVPALLLACVGAQPAVVALVLALAACIGMLYAILPWPLGIAIALTPAAIQTLPVQVSLPAPGSPDFLPCASIAVLILLALATWRWRQMLRPGGIHTRGLFRSTIMGLNQNLISGANLGRTTVQPGLSGHRNELQMLRRRPAWMQPRANLHHTGPKEQRHQHTLRVALGSAYLPRTLRDRARTLLPGAASLLLVAVVLAWVVANPHKTVHGLWQWAGLFTLGCAGFCANLWLPLATGGTLHQRFTRANGELPLLALLPHLGSASAVKRDLFRACFVVPLRAQGVATLLLMLVALALHLRGSALLLVLVAQLGSMLWLGASVLDTLGGRLLSLWVRVPVVMLTCIVFSLSCWLPLTTLGATPWPAAHVIVTSLLAAWVPVGAALLWISHRGWRALELRPHPFMPVDTAHA